MAREQKQRVEEKVKTVRAYLVGKISMSEAAKRSSVNYETVRDWVRNYEADGVDAFLPHKNRGYSLELKHQAVTEYLSRVQSLNDVCKKYHIRDKKQLRNWIKGELDSVKHSGGGSYMKQGRETTQAERIQIAKECIASGKNYGEMALKYKVSYQQARAWTLRFEELGESGLEDRRGKRKRDQAPRTELEKLQIENEQLKHELYLAEMENDLLKKLDEIERRDAFRK